MLERRATPRHRVFKAGSIEFDGAKIDCTIRNLSSAGATLEVGSPVGIPHEIILILLKRQLRQRCFVVWRKERRMGVVFNEWDEVFDTSLA
jgi:PilZ domain